MVCFHVLFQGNDVLMDETDDADGFVKFLSDAKTDRLLGVHLVCSVCISIVDIACY